MAGSRYPLEVRPVIPEALARLEELAGNLLYSWDRRTRGLFLRIDPSLWEECEHNPTVFLRRVPQERFEALQAIFGDRVGLLHGQMPGRDKDAAMAAFSGGQTPASISAWRSASRVRPDRLTGVLRAGLVAREMSSVTLTDEVPLELSRPL